jgi:UDP-2-acetamido-2,6-beta-L-arabino-hexul-4-ose reductase
MTTTKVVVTGAGGFIGLNLQLRMAELKAFDIRPIEIDSSDADLSAALSDADAVVHLAGINRPKDPAEFMVGNRDSLTDLCDEILATDRKVPIILTSSIHADGDSAYGQSKKAGELALLAFAEASGNPAHIFRLPNVFGKWCRPNYNSAVATFCHNVARGLPISVNDPAAPLSLVYIDDVVSAIIDLVVAAPGGHRYHEVTPVYNTTVGAIAGLIQQFRDDRADAMIESVGVGLTRALYATYVSALPPEEFSYPLVTHTDPRGSFSEMLKTRTSGQFSFFTAHPGVTRGGHYHHTKTEKFLVVQGEAMFKFRHMLSGDVHEVRTSGATPMVVETVPGWTHDITNVGKGELIAMLWANEVFDRAHADTIAEKV